MMDLVIEVVDEPGALADVATRDRVVFGSQDLDGLKVALGQD